MKDGKAATVGMALVAMGAIWYLSKNRGIVAAPALAGTKVPASITEALALSEDPGAQTYSSQLTEYQAYKAAGGVQTFENFSLYSLDEAGTKWYNWKLSGEFVAEPVGRTGGEIVAPPTRFAQPSTPDIRAILGNQPVVASSQQLDTIAAIVGQDSPTYQSVIDTAVRAAVAEADASGGVVSWTSEGGYQAVAASSLSYEYFD
ncbi:MAG: hypothetical protein KKB38_20070 [Gammaproteobacteria bacterium]|nr:hypothetical protein [Gammaproteobacteria bacterium]